MGLKRRLILGGLAATVLLVAAPAGAQEDGRYVVCAGKRLWLVDGARAARTISCPGRDRVFSLATENREAARAKPDGGARELLNLLRPIRSADVKPARLARAQFESAVRRRGAAAVTVAVGDLPKPVREFFGFAEEAGLAEDAGLAEEAGAGSAFIITQGVYYSQYDKYEETRRCVVRLSDPNPYVGEVLEEAKKCVTDEHLEHIKPHLYLEHPRTRERLYRTRTVAEYGIKSGGVLRLFSDVR